MSLVLTTAYAQSIQDLDFLIGTWELSEVANPGTPSEYIEKGTRTCEYYLRGNYIKCESNGVRKGRDRSYTFLFTYEKKEDRIKLIKISSDFDAHSIKSWAIDKENKIITEEDMTGYQFVSSISYENRDEIIWRGYSPKVGKEPSLQLVFEERAVRQ